MFLTIRYPCPYQKKEKEKKNEEERRGEERRYNKQVEGL